jgi:hypothetical protein
MILETHLAAICCGRFSAARPRGNWMQRHVAIALAARASFLARRKIFVACNRSRRALGDLEQTSIDNSSSCSVRNH